MNPIVTANVWNRCNLKCRYCVSSAPNRWRDRFEDGRDFSAVLDVDALISWLDKFRPTASVNVSGGEPLLYSGIEDWLWKLMDTGRRVTLLTNGLLVHNRVRLHDAPMGWIATYHCGAGLDPEKYIERLSVLKGREDVSLRVLMRGRGDLTQLSRLRKIFDGFEVSPKFVNDEKRAVREFGCPDVAPPEHIASEFLTLVENNGKVYACNCKEDGEIGDVYAMTFDDGKARRRDKRAAQCWTGGFCGACQTAKELVTNGR